MASPSGSGAGFPSSIFPSAPSPASFLPQTPLSATSASGRDDRKPKRGIRQLNEQQLAKKRQNDREAQRAIRERTKNQIESLEQKVKELESGQAYRQLQDLIREKAALKEENDGLKKRLESIYAIVEPALLPPTIANEAYPPIKSNPASPGPERYDTRLPLIDTEQATASSFIYGSGRYASESSGPTELHSPSDQMLIHASGWASTRKGSSHAQGRKNSSLADPRSSVDSGLDTKVKQSRNSSVMASPSSYGARTSYYPTLSDSNARSQSSTAQSPYTPRSLPSPREILQAHGPPAHSQLPSHIHPTCQYDTILFDFVNECRKRMAMGQSVDELLGVPYPDMTALLYPDTANTSRPNSLSNLLVGTLKGFTSLVGYTPRISLVVTTFYIVRWLISPTQENYEMIPEHNRPIEEQIRVPHPIWVDIIQWPALRAKLVYQFPGLSLEAFFLPYTSSLSVSWPTPEDPWTCVFRYRRHAARFDGDCRDAEGYTEDIRPLPTYEQHVRNLDNWSVGPEFAEAFPWLAGTCKIKRQEHGRKSLDNA